MSLTDAPFGLAVTNPATSAATVQAGVPATLAVTVVNNSGADIPLPADAGAAAEFDAYLPDSIFSRAQVAAMTVTADGWSAALAADDPPYLAITRTGGGQWAAGQPITFTLAGATSSGPPANGNVSLIPANLGDDAPPIVDAPLSVVTPPRPGNLQLADVLQVTLDSQGAVLRSASAADPLANTLYLTLKNTGAAALADGGKRFGDPRVLVSFIYGSTSGALAPDAFDPARGPQPGSAWNIKSGISSAQLPWTTADPRHDSQQLDPQWTLAPSPANLALLGPASGDQAGVTFSFSNVVSVTPAGHTQMLVLCTGFARDATTLYDDHLFVLDIPKVDAPPTRGLLSFFGPDPVIPIASPTTPVTIPLRWSMFDVASVHLLSSSAAVAPLRRSYPVPPKPVDYDSATVTVPAPPSSEAIFFTLQAFDAGGGYLNSQQFTAYAQVSYVADVTGHVYPVALFGGTYWMLENYRLNLGGSYDYGDNPGNEAAFGRLYDSRVLTQPPAGWTVPTVADWTALFTSFGDAKAAYKALASGGPAGFNAQLGGHRVLQPNGSGTYEQLYSYGYYWAGPGTAGAQFSATSGQAVAGTPVPSGAALSVRFIRHA
ncbi:MAG TPA: FISUMP domain-containing protein [Trebonia sp.]|nr:FISUMP domain-containing protein [Trebonia sp.]